MPGKLVLVVDNINNFDYQLRDITRRIIESGKSVLVLVATRDRFEPRAASNISSAVPDSNKNFHEIECNWLNAKDTLNLAKHLISKERLGPKLRGMSELEIQKYFHEHSSKILLAAMLDAFSSGGHENLVKDEYDSLSELGKSIYRFAALSHSRGETLDLYIFSRASNLSAIKIWKHVSCELEDDTRYELRSIVKGIEVTKYKAITTRHQTIAEVVVKSALSPAQNFETVSHLCKAISSFAGKESAKSRDTIYRLGRALIDQRWLTDELSIPKEKVESLFVELEEAWSWNYHYWIQRATFELHKTRNFKKAWDYCKAALERESRPGIAHVTYANICFHWAKSEEKFDSTTRYLVTEAVDTLKTLQASKYEDRLMYLVAIRGLFHIAAKYKKFSEFDSQIKWWITELKAQGNLDRKITSFIDTAEQILKGAPIKESFDFPVILDELDFYGPS